MGVVRGRERSGERVEIKSGRYAIIEQFLANGIECMFGNPGTVEQGSLHAVREYPRMKYVLTLQESVALTMGDGYARATGSPRWTRFQQPRPGQCRGAL